MSHARTRTAKKPSRSTTIDRTLLRKWALPKLGDNADKSARGDVMVIGGSAEVPGAVLLTGIAALRAGAGRVRVATARSAASPLGIAFPEARVIGLSEDRSGELARKSIEPLLKELDACGSIVIGPGMRSHAAAEAMLSSIRARKVSCDGTLVLDAAALRLLAGRRAFRAGSFRSVIATPHAGEMAQLWGCTREEVESNALSLALEAAKTLELVMVLKGVETWIATPEGNAFQNVAGNSGLATAGSGDVLAGLIAGMAARGADPVRAALWGVHLHALAGDALAKKHGPLGYLAREILDEIPRVLGSLEK